MDDSQGANQDVGEIAKALDSNCKRFHTLDQSDRYTSPQQMRALLEHFSGDLTRLHVLNLYSEELVQGTPVAAKFISTIEILVAMGESNHLANTIPIAKRLPRLRALRMGGDLMETDLSDLMKTNGCALEALGDIGGTGNEVIQPTVSARSLQQTKTKAKDSSGDSRTALAVAIVTQTHHSQDTLDAAIHET
ncbi:hypothetical protein B0O80DRAFT_498852 [Mortierella sp. GBAus27b]|nr:hypothetical protein BGX31_007958 [Mortierella sp. GBA43]KAI8353421.1 hypothetical protein B0O80DRAFT_498852 [Mortierella sp. GBAus27b]